MTATFTARASAAMLANPPYFVWWYTIKSIALVLAAALAAYYAGKSKGIQIGTQASGRWSQFNDSHSRLTTQGHLS